MNSPKDANPSPNTTSTVDVLNSMEKELLERRNQMLDRIEGLSDELNDLRQAVDHINGFLNMDRAETVQAPRGSY